MGKPQPIRDANATMQQLSIPFMSFSADAVKIPCTKCLFDDLRTSLGATIKLLPRTTLQNLQNRLRRCATTARAVLLKCVLSRKHREHPVTWV